MRKAMEELRNLYRKLTTLECDLLRFIANKEQRSRLRDSHRGAMGPSVPVSSGPSLRFAAEPTTASTIAVELCRLYKQDTTTRHVEDYLGPSARNSLAHKAGVATREQLINYWKALITWAVNNLDTLLPSIEVLEDDRIQGREVAERAGKVAIMLQSFRELFPDHPACSDLPRYLFDLLYIWAYASYTQPVGAIPVRLPPLIAELEYLERELGNPQLKLFSVTLRSIDPYLDKDYMENQRWLTWALDLYDQAPLFNPFQTIFLATGSLVADGLAGDERAYKRNARKLTKRLDNLPDDARLNAVKDLNIALAQGRALGNLGDRAKDKVMLIKAWGFLADGWAISDQNNGITQFPQEVAKLAKATLELAGLAPELTPAALRDLWISKGWEAAQLSRSRRHIDSLRAA